MAKLLSPDGARDFLVRRFNNQHQAWLAGGGTWPLQIPLGVPTEKDAIEDKSSVRSWVSSWAAWKNVGEVSHEVRKWARLGAQELPVALTVSNAEDVATLVGQEPRWTRAKERHTQMVDRWPQLGNGGALAARFSVLADYSEVDFRRLISLLDWLVQNPASNVYLRQLPVEGLDTKWAEQRIGVITGLLKDIRQDTSDDNFHEVCGLLRPSHRIRIKLLCPELRKLVGGLRDFEAPIEEIAALQIQPTGAVIVENLDTGRALPDIAGTVAIMKLGNAVSGLGSIPWLKAINAVYWGDIDTHGFAILDRARTALPMLRSVLMDEATTLGYRHLWGTEPVQTSNFALRHLNDHELKVYTGLKANTGGQKVRLEQERLPWGFCIAAILEALKADSLPAATQYVDKKFGTPVV
jgi:hypothetical protein